MKFKQRANMQALGISGLRKVYPNGTIALKDIDLSVAPGDFFGFLGENGAGKSTTIGIITSLILKTAGTVKVFGYDLDKDLSEAKRCIGLVPQEMNFNIFEKVIDVLFYQAGYYGISREVAKKKAEFYLKKLGLWDQRNAKCMYLSGGMKRRLMIVRSLLHLNHSRQHPSLLILDEPTAGVDVELRHIIWDFLKELNERGTTIILTTHYLEEAEYLCKNVAIINEGKIIEQSKMSDLVRRLDVQTIICDLKSTPPILPQTGAFRIRSRPTNQIEVDIKRGQIINEIFDYFKQHNIEVMNLYPKDNRLEKVFLDLINTNTPRL